VSLLKTTKRCAAPDAICHFLHWEKYLKLFRKSNLRCDKLLIKKHIIQLLFASLSSYRKTSGPAAPAPAAAGGQEAGQGEQGLEEVGHVAVLLRRALQHFRPARMVRETGFKRVAYFSGMAA